VICRDDVADGFAYVLCPDDPPVVADRLRAVVRWLAVDEITRLAPEVDFAVTTSNLGLTPRVSSGGRMGLVGNPARLYPGLDLGSVDIGYSVAAPGFLPRHRTLKLGPIAGFPNAFAPKDDGVLSLHREPIVIRGRVGKLGGLDPTPLAGATVRLAGVWSTFPPYNVVPDTVIEPPNLLALYPGLYADRLTATDGVRKRDLVLAAGEEKTLVRPAVPGDVDVRISDRTNLNPGDLLAFETARPDHAEYVLVHQVFPGAVSDEPATVRLEYPLALAHEQGTVCVRATPQVPLATNTLTRDGIPAERVAFLSALTGFFDGATVEILGGATPEWQTVHLYETTSDADGFYRLPPISRVASVKLHADSGALTPQEPVTSPDYRRYDNFVDVIFP
jgi:hypothetical protein